MVPFFLNLETSPQQTAHKVFMVPFATNRTPQPQKDKLRP